MPLENIDLDSPDLGALPQLEESRLEEAVHRSIEVNGVHAWSDHMHEARNACNDELSVKQLSQILVKAIEEAI